VANAGPDRDHARWFCHRCGATWTANLGVTARPTPRFAGYDEAKAVRAAARAATLDRQRRRLAVERAGLRPTAARLTRRTTPGPRPLDPAVGDSVAHTARSTTGRKAADGPPLWQFGSQR
jgi:hypothetical protein